MKRINCKFTVGSQIPVTWARYETLKEYIKIVAERVGLKLFVSSTEEETNG